MSVHIEAKQGEIADKNFTAGRSVTGEIYRGKFFRRCEML